jgi:hypothetical protein
LEQAARSDLSRVLNGLKRRVDDGNNGLKRRVDDGKNCPLPFALDPLFPERIAYTVPYKLSPAEAQLYKEVTEYVREEFNRAEALQNDKRAGTVRR